MAAKKKNRFIARAERERRQSRVLTITMSFVGVVVAILVGIGMYQEYVVQPNLAAITVNGNEISITEYRGEFLLSRSQQQRGEEQDLFTIAESVTSRLTSMMLVEQEMQSRGIFISEDEVQDAIYKMFGFDPDASVDDASIATDGADEDDTLTPLPTPTAYTRAMFDENFQNLLAGLDEFGADEAAIRGTLRRELYMEAFIDSIRADIPVIMDQVQANHIMIADEETALEIITRLEAGDEWAMLVNEYSLDEGSKENDGSLGWFHYEHMVSAFADNAFADTAFATPIGEISAPVQTNFGWHIIQVVAHEERVMDPAIMENEVWTAYNQWISQALQDAEISVETEMIQEMIRDEFPNYQG